MNGGFIIQETPCPSCRIKRTVRLGVSKRALCLNCRYQWTIGGNTPSDIARLIDHFTSEEWKRLAAYRAAVQAGLYNDWPERDGVTY
jgi:hypothetical protein